MTSVGPNRKISTSGNTGGKFMPTAGPNIGATGFDFKKKTPIVNSGKPTVKKSEPGIGNRGIASHKSST